jgi:glycosyltransferase involved in cell wall biosynthesis
VANNTFDVGSRPKSYDNQLKNKILFVGSFDYRKRNDILVKAFSQILADIPNDIKLCFVGDGIEKEKIELLVSELGILSRVEFLGRVNDPEKLSEIYQEAIFTVSYGQAGLSVLQSLGFGVPYITSLKAISGGEISNIQQGLNGYFCDDFNSFKMYMVKLINDLKLARLMGLQAYEYYSANCTVDNMVNGFDAALNDFDL